MGASPTNADQLVLRVCRVLARHDPRLNDWSATKRGADLRLEFSLGDARFGLLVQPATVDRAWARTPSLAFSIQTLGDAPIAMAAVEPWLRQLVELVGRSDDGTLTLSEPPAASGADHARPPSFDDVTHTRRVSFPSRAWICHSASCWWLEQSSRWIVSVEAS